MSRIGNNPVKLPPKVEVTLAAGEITVKGPLGTLSRSFGADVDDREGRRTARVQGGERRSAARCTARCARWSRTWSRA